MFISLFQTGICPMFVAFTHPLPIARTLSAQCCPGLQPSRSGVVQLHPQNGARPPDGIDVLRSVSPGSRDCSDLKSFGTSVSGNCVGF